MMRAVLTSCALAFCTLALAAADAPSPPLPPLPTSPVATFRKLLTLDDKARQIELQSRTDDQRRVLMARISEYESLPAHVREARLRATDLYWHFQQLLQRSPDERARLLEAAPEDLRPVLSERLALWDSLAEADRNALLQHELALRYLAQLRAAPPPPLPGEPPSTNRPGAVSREAQEILARYQQLPPAERARIHQQWKRFFEAPPLQANRTLRAMSEAERREMEIVLARMRELPPAQRQACIDSFARFASMSAQERSAFLRSAKLWETLPPEERATWRHLVTKLPPLPPIDPPVRFPPTPPETSGSRRAGPSALDANELSSH